MHCFADTTCYSSVSHVQGAKRHCRTAVALAEAARGLNGDGSYETGAGLRRWVVLIVTWLQVKDGLSLGYGYDVTLNIK